MMDREEYRPGLSGNKDLMGQLKELQKNPKSLIFVSLAESYRKEGLPHQALEILEEGLAFHPNLASAVLAKARCLFDLRRYAEALAQTQSAIQMNPQNLRAQKLQAEIYLRLGQRKAAIRALTRVVILYPQDLEAVRSLEELENIESGPAVTLSLVGRASLDSAPGEGKIEDFHVDTISHSLSQIGVSAPDQSESNGRIFQGVKITEESLEAPQAEEEGETEPTFATRTIAELYLRQGLRGKALRVLRKILREDPTNFWARETLQELESDGIVLPAKATHPKSAEASALKRRAKVLELLLARVRILKRIG